MASTSETEVGERPTPVTASFLFVDLVGSTELRVQLGDDANDVLEARFLATLRGALHRWGGEEIRSLGDGLAVAFPASASRAVGCAVDMVRSVARLSRQLPDVELAVRVGVAAGEAAVVRGGSWTGRAVAEAARLVDVADPNTILVTDVVRTLAGTRGEHEFHRVGDLALRGFPDEVSCWQVSWSSGGDVVEAADVPEAVEGSLAGLIASPYRGLLAFREQDAAWFWGREAETAAIVERLESTGFIALVGSSGVGKTSLLNAGVIPALGGGPAQRGSGTAVVRLTPRSRPGVELAASLAQALGLSASELLTCIELTPGRLGEDVAEALDRVGGERLVVVVDQLEELFTAGSAADDRLRFVTALVSLGAASVPVVVALRSDFLSHAATIAPLAAALSDGAYLVPPISSDGLRALIERPAEMAGLAVERGLTERLLHDVEGQPGSLPLLSHALYEAWRRRTSDTLTIETYEAVGGVEGAIAATAEAEFEGLKRLGETVVREVFVRLTELGDGVEDTRRRERIDSLATIDPSAATIVAQLVGARLLVADGDHVEVAHEALIREWPRLRAWLDEDRDRLRTRRHLSRVASEWDRRGRDDADLYRGSRLELAERAVQGALLDDIERAFLDASEQQRADEESQAQAIAAERSRQHRRMRRTLVVLAAALVLALVGAGIALAQTRRAARSEDRAIARTRDADYQRLVSQSAELLPTDRRLGALLALEALRLHDGPEARSALLRLFERTPGHIGSVELEEVATAGAAVPGTGDAALALADGTVQILRTGPHADAARRLTSKITVGSEGGSGDGLLLMVGGGALLAVRPDGSVLRIDVDGGGATEIVASTGSSVRAAAADHESGEFAIADGAGVIQRWDKDGDPLPELRVESDVTSMTYRGGERPQLVVAHPGRLEAWDVERGLLTASWSTGALKPSLVQVDGAIAAHPGGDLVVVHDPATARMLAIDGAGKAVFDRDVPMFTDQAHLAFSPDGARLYRSDDRGTILEVDQTTGEDLEAVGQTQLGRQAALAALDETIVVSSAVEPTVELWSTLGESPVVTHLRGQGLGPVEFSPDGKLLLAQVLGTPPSLSLWDPSTGAMVQDRLPALSAAFSGRTELGVLLTGNRGGYLDLDTMELIDVNSFDTSSVWRARNTDALSVVSFSDGRVEVYDRRTGSIRLTIDTAGAIQLSVRADDGAIAVTSPAGEAAIYDSEDGSVLLDGIDGVAGLAFDHTGRKLYVATMTGELQTLDAQTGRVIEPTFTQSPTPSAGLAVDCCGRWLGAVDYSGGMRLFDLPSGQQIGDPLNVDHQQNWTGALDPTGRRAAVQVEGGIDVFDLALSTWIEGACGLAGRNLTAAEWSTYLPNAGARRATCAMFPS